MLKRTPLFELHQKLGGRLVEFGGWEMPVQYTSIMDEHLAVRKAAGIFDISHMGEVTASGAAAADFLNYLLTNDINKLTPGTGQYTLMCNERGGVIDDLYAFRLCGDVYFLIINAGRIEVDVAWIHAQAAKFPRRSELCLTDASHNYAAIAVQGPNAKEFINDVIPGASISAMRVARATDLQKNQIGGFIFEKQSVLVSRTGYTGEDGFEIVGSDESIRRLWDKCLTIGRRWGLKPAGLGARDTLRTEARYPLYGHELDENTTPIEAGLGYFVALDKGDFIGRAILAEQKTNGVAKKRVAFKMTDKSAPPRPHYPIWSTVIGTPNSDSAPHLPLSHTEAQLIGEVTSGTQSPSLNIGIGMGYVKPEFAKPGTNLEIEIRGKRFPAVVVSKI
jgi:aminomethyltransferase